MISRPMFMRYIFEQLFRLCPPFKMPEKWIALPVDKNVRACPENGNEVLQALASAFKPAELVRAGVARMENDCLTPANALLTSGAPLLFLRPRVDVCPIDVISPHGVLSGRQIPLITSLCDHHVCSALETWGGYLLVACSLDDVVLLRSLGLPATLGTGLASLSPKQFRSLCNHLGWKKPFRKTNGASAWQQKLMEKVVSSNITFPSVPSLPVGLQGGQPAPPPVSSQKRPPATSATPTAPTKTAGASATAVSAVPAAATAKPVTPTSPSAEVRSTKPTHEIVDHAQAGGEDDDVIQEDKPIMMLIGWSLSSLHLEKPVGVSAIQTHLRALNKHLNIAGMDVGIWIPDPSYVEQLSYQIYYGSFQGIATEMSTQIDENNGDALYLNPHAPPSSPPSNYQEARQQLSDATRASLAEKGSSQRVCQARRTYEELMEKEVIQPLHQPKASPHIRNLQNAQMSLSRICHRLSWAVEEQLAQTSPESLLRNATPICQRQVQQLRQIVQTIIAVNKEIRS